MEECSKKSHEEILHILNVPDGIVTVCEFMDLTHTALLTGTLSTVFDIGEQTGNSDYFLYPSSPKVRGLNCATFIAVISLLVADGRLACEIPDQFFYPERYDLELCTALDLTVSHNESHMSGILVTNGKSMFLDFVPGENGVIQRKGYSAEIRYNFSRKTTKLPYATIYPGSAWTPAFKMLQVFCK